MPHDVCLVACHCCLYRPNEATMYWHFPPLLVRHTCRDWPSWAGTRFSFTWHLMSTRDGWTEETLCNFGVRSLDVHIGLCDRHVSSRFEGHAPISTHTPARMPKRGGSR